MAGGERQCGAVHMQHGEAAGSLRRDKGAHPKRIRGKMAGFELIRLAVRLCSRLWG